jgi:transglutaminase/protease-like cytokinesis protein 3
MTKLGSLILLVVICSTSRAQSNEIQKADSIANLYPGHSLSDLGLLSYHLTSPLQTDVGKFRAIYTWVCTNIQGDYELMEYCRRKRAKLKGGRLDRWSREFNTIIIQTLLDRRRTLCKGYVWLVRELALKAGIDCEIITGYARSARSNIGGNGVANHSWNAVMLDGKWYLCDPTWSSGAVTPENEFTTSYNDAYFLTDPEWFVLNHYPLDVKWTLMEHPPGLHEFLNRPLIYISAFKYRVMPDEPTSFYITTTKGHPVAFNYLENGKEAVKTATYQKRGRYAYHIKINNEYVITYRVTVR